MRNADIDVSGEVVLESAGGRGSNAVFYVDGPVVLICAEANIAVDTVRLQGSVWMEAEEIITRANLNLKIDDAKVGWGGQFAKQFPWNRWSPSLSAPYESEGQDKVSQLIRECRQRLPDSVTLTLHLDLTPGTDDPQMRWARRRFEEEFPKLMALMLRHNLASQEPMPASGKGKTRVRFATRWSDLQEAVADPTTHPRLRAFVEDAMRELNE